MTLWGYLSNSGHLAGCVLPSLGIVGNSHAMMADDNSDAVAEIVLDWLRQRGCLN
jgi:hypothetical protein